MIVHRRASWIIGAIAILIFLASISSAASAKLRKPGKKSTPKVPYHNGPMIIKLISKYADDDPIHDIFSDCTQNTCRDARENLDVSETHSEQNNLLPDERYVVYPKKYEHFVSKKKTRHANRYRRYIALPEIHSWNATDRAMLNRCGNASETLKNENKSKLKKVALYKTRKYIKIKDPAKSSSETNGMRKRRSINDYTSRRNASDYYAQRKAVMERYYARQREINARYSNRTSTISRFNETSWNRPVTSNVTLFRLGGHEYPNKNSTARDSAIFHHPSILIDPIYSNESEINGIATKVGSRQNIVPGNGLGFKFNTTGLLQTWNNSNVERNAQDYYVTPTPCTNISLSGTFAPKKHSKHDKNCTDEAEQSNENFVDSSTIKPTDNKNGNHQSWGECKGKIVYQHNLLLGLKSQIFSNLDTLFEVIIQGSVCITCVEALRYNETRAIVLLDSGGRGYEYVKLRLIGYRNEGFSYIIKIWAVAKNGPDCNNID